ncbi:hypothetical protein BDR07DRAFT_1375068 [Suillus spraguei]|nr:hypothetical protein BDR07DRAFT_1375068 [Suillus spraguei]
MSHLILSEFDIIFAGGGTTACVVAGRLAAYDPSLKILILEAGQHTLDKPIHVQPYQHPFNLAPTSTTVTFHVGNPSPHLNGRAPIVACGRCVGGSSCVNDPDKETAMVYTRAPASDYDDWGVDGWESENLIPLMKKLETYEVPDRPTHGYNGPIKVSSDGCEVGIGAEFIQVGTTYHKRQYAEDTEDLETCNTYSPWRNSQPKFTSLGWKAVKRIVFEGKRAVGVEFTSDLVSCPDADQSSSIVRASKLVIVSAGTFGSPTILEKSGIGAKGFSSDHNMVFIPYLAADEAVTIDALWRGESILQAIHKYPNVESLAQWNSGGKSLISRNCIDSKIKWRPDDEELKAMDPIFQTRWKEFFQDRPDKAVATFGVLAGTALRLPHALPLVCWKRSYQSDRERKEGMDFTTGFLDEGKRCSLRRSVRAGGLEWPDIIYTAEDDEAINRFHRDVAQTAWHSLGTCAMKPEADKGVVDTRLNVYGVSNLKVADMSIAPLNVGRWY